MKKSSWFWLVGSIILFSTPACSIGPLTIAKEETETKPEVIVIERETGRSETPTLTTIPTTTETAVTIMQSPSATLEPTKTATLEPTKTATETATSQPVEATDDDSEIYPTTSNLIDDAQIVYVPEGEFLMGSDPENDPYFWGAEGPSHVVMVDAFWIYQLEVTNAMYQACVEEQACPRPLRHESRTVEDYYTNPDYADYPVIQVNWVDAVSYCVWAGGRLPTEAEWEKAARGTDGRLFPWGNESLQPNYASFCGSACPGVEKESTDDGYYEIAPVGMFPAGASPFGALDMAGNVMEWVNDFFDSGYYVNSPYENPLGPLTGTRHVIRGGSWFNPASGLRTVGRASIPTNDGLDTIGFRCVIDASSSDN